MLPRLFARQSKDYLLSLGVPVDWLPTIREIADEDQLLTVADKLPEEVAERLTSAGRRRTGHSARPRSSIAADLGKPGQPPSLLRCPRGFGTV